jgi:hypothetical protein
MNQTPAPKQAEQLLHRLLLGVVVLTVVVILSAGYSLYRAHQHSAQTTVPLGHGGACDDQTYYNQHIRECAVQ